ncbi:MAG: hypothetical protein GY953_05200, partial [bacterium]|nr:hypothetical protein [bacterium]
MKVNRRTFLGSLAAALPVVQSCGTGAKQTLHVIPNFHPAVMGWLAPYHVERNYCLYAYLDHQDHALKDPDYRYVVSEIPHLITMLERRPERFEELKQVVRQGKTEMVNAFVVEPTVNLSGGEALVMQGVEGLRWYDQVMGLKPRHCWMIDVCGWHEQMAQIVKGLGLESFAYSRYNPTGTADDLHGIAKEMDSIHWLESPDGSRTLAVNPDHYFAAFRPLMRTTEALPDEEVLQEISDTVELQKSRFPDGAPLLAFSGQEDYSLSFLYKGYPAELLEIWQASEPDTELRFSTLSDWFDEFLPGAESGKYPLKTIKSGSRIYGWPGFWINGPRVKQDYRRLEHGLQASEALAAIASLDGDATYPSQDFSNAWFLMALNMDRNSLWAAAVHATYQHPRSWDMVDRFQTVDSISRKAAAQAASSLLRKAGSAMVLFNSSSWGRNGAHEVALPAGQVPEGAETQLLEDGRISLVAAKLPAGGIRSFPTRSGKPAPGKPISLPTPIETSYYQVIVDPKTASLTSLKWKASGKELLGDPANVIMAETRGVKHAKTVFAHEIPRKADRVKQLTSEERTSRIKVTAGPLATIVEAVCPFSGGELRRVMRFHGDSPRIDFVTETNDVPHGTVITALFPLADDVTEVRRAIPYGFSHGAWSKPNAELHGINNSIVPAIRWSHYALAGGGGVALLDRGVPGREIEGNTPLMVLENATHIYYWDQDAKWISGEGKHRFEYAFVAHDTDWKNARIPQLAWDYNAPPLMFPGAAADQERSWIEASDNLLLQALRRTGDEIELRFVECFGQAGTATALVNLPHTAAALTNLVGEERQPLEPG